MFRSSLFDSPFYFIQDLTLESRNVTFEFGNLTVWNQDFTNWKENISSIISWNPEYKRWFLAHFRIYSRFAIRSIVLVQKFVFLDPLFFRALAFHLLRQKLCRPSAPSAPPSPRRRPSPTEVPLLKNLPRHTNATRTNHQERILNTHQELILNAPPAGAMA